MADEAPEEHNGPWCWNVESAIVRVSSMLLSKRFYQLSIVWFQAFRLVFCSSRIVNHQGSCEPRMVAPDACWKFDGRDLISCAPSPANHVYVSVSLPLSDPSMERDTMRLESFPDDN